MRTFEPDQAVHVTVDGAELDGIVLEAPGITKVVVATADGTFHTVHPKHVKARSEEGDDDEHLRELVHKARTAGRRSGGRGGVGARAGFHGPTPHRPTGRGG